FCQVGRYVPRRHRVGNYKDVYNIHPEFTFSYSRELVIVTLYHLSLEMYMIKKKSIYLEWLKNYGLIVIVDSFLQMLFRRRQQKTRLNFIFVLCMDKLGNEILPNKDRKPKTKYTLILQDVKIACK
ncbi:hypothetical protein CR513_18699, partial [Mucuna pruriens]